MKPAQVKEGTRTITQAGIGSQESTELSLFVRTSDEDIKEWDRQRIHDAHERRSLTH